MTCKCIYCSKTVSVLTKGTIKPHLTAFGQWCIGSGQQPCDLESNRERAERARKILQGRKTS